jgi:hypothetical protein
VKVCANQRLARSGLGCGAYRSCRAPDLAMASLDSHSSSIKRDLDLRHIADQEQLAKSEARHQADLVALEEAKARTASLEPKTEEEPIRLAVEPFIKSLDDAYPYAEERPGYLIDIGLAHRAFAVLSIQNEGRRDLRKVIARCSLVGSGELIPCFWSGSADGKFAQGGRVSEDLDVWHTRLLVIAWVYEKDKLWTRLPADSASLFSIVHLKERDLAQRIGEVRAISPAGEHLDLGAKVEVAVSFGAEEFRQTEHFLLSFNFEGPTVTPMPPADPPRSTAL